MNDSPNRDLPSQPSLSPFETVVAFDPVRPLARIPVRAGQGDDLARGPLVLAFRSEDAWRRAWRSCRQKIELQCQAGATVGCSLAAAKACGRPWWTKLALPGFVAAGRDEDQSKAREECEAREMRGCLLSSQERCVLYARETCDAAFADMRIAVPGAPIDRRFDGQPLRRPRVTRHDKLGSETQKHSPLESRSPESTASEDDSERLSSSSGITTFRGRLLLQHERTREESSWDGMPPPSWSWSAAAATHAHEPSTPPFPSEGWVGGLVHPAAAPRTNKLNSATNEEGEEGGGSVPKGPAGIALDLWQSVVERFTGS